MNMTEAREKATEIRARYAQDLKAITNDKDLTDSAKRQKTRALYEQSREEMGALRKEVDGARNDTVRQLERRLFGPKDGDHAGQRAVIGLAASLATPGAAREAMGRARRTGDDELARAVYMRASERGWSGVVREYLADNPEAAKTAEELGAMRAEDQSAASRIATSAVFTLNHPSI